VAIDWESSRPDAPPFYDVFHYLVQSCALLRRPSKEAIVRGVLGRTGEISVLIQAYANGARLGTDGVTDYFLEYIKLSRADIDPAKPKGATSLRVRSELERRVRLQL
jgi:hypothetical protein